MLDCLAHRFNPQQQTQRQPWRCGAPFSRRTLIVRVGRGISHDFDIQMCFRSCQRQLVQQALRRFDDEAVINLASHQQTIAVAQLLEEALGIGGGIAGDDCGRPGCCKIDCNSAASRRNLVAKPIARRIAGTISRRRVALSVISSVGMMMQPASHPPPKCRQRSYRKRVSLAGKVAGGASSSWSSAACAMPDSVVLEKMKRMPS